MSRLEEVQVMMIDTAKKIHKASEFAMTDKSSKVFFEREYLPLLEKYKAYYEEYKSLNPKK